MTYSIIGSGNVGLALARQFARSNMPVGIANSRGPEAIDAVAKQIGSQVTPLTLADACKADVIILAVPFRAHLAVGGALSDWTGKIVIDAMNTYGIPPEELKGRESSDAVADAFPGARVVKSLNQLPANLLGLNPAADGGRRVMFVSSNDRAASQRAAQLVGDLGFAPIELGKINEGGSLLGMGGPLILQNLIQHGRQAAA